ncbi:hypothetical protein MMC10_008716 [Thelotrema lepadinum]|nr:hypothetical protein [Thelotrema lepadinum]
MLPKPTSSFTIPSIHDDAELECRLYHPLKSAHGGEYGSRRGAIIAHPYAPLGGCIDDPVVNFVGEAILKQGYVLGLFNFRGAGASKGRTSWSGKPEQADYISFVGFFVLYLYGLESGGLVFSTALSPTSNQALSPISVDSTFGGEGPITLILGGYSYGSLITSQLPDIEALVSMFSHVTKGSAAAEIRLRAFHMCKEHASESRRARQRGRTLTVEDALDGTVYGGEECEPGTRRVSRESRRSIEVVRKSVEVSRARLHLKRRHSEEVSRSSNPGEQLEALSLPRPHVCFLLISPVLSPVSSFLTMFSKQQWKPRWSSHAMVTSDDSVKEKFGRNQTFAIFGDNDFFTSGRKLQRWATSLTSQPNSRFVHHEVAEAGHFWQEDGVESELERAITSWIQSLDSTPERSA